jgi:hypothetical protein
LAVFLCQPLLIYSFAVLLIISPGSQKKRPETIARWYGWSTDGRDAEMET